MNHRRESNVDWFGRLLGFLGIVVGGAASAYFYLQNESRKSEITAAEKVITDTAEENLDAADQFNADWNKQLIAALNDFNQRANAAIDKEIDLSANREKAFREQLAKVTSSSGELDTLVEKKYEDLQIQLATPRLRLAQSLMKPVDAGDAVSIVIKNDGNREAELTRVTFSPTSQFLVSQSSLTNTGLESANRLVVRFSKEHNTATEEGRHADYVRRFEEPEYVPGNNYVQLRIEIENAEHLDWAFEGTLTIEYDDGEKLTIPNAEALFVRPRGDAA